MGVCQIWTQSGSDGPKWHTSGTFSNHISVHFGSGFVSESDPLMAQCKIPGLAVQVDHKGDNQVNLWYL